MDTTFFLHALLSAASAVVYASVLVQPGMLLAPVQAGLRRWHKRQWLRRAVTTLQEYAQKPMPESGLMELEQDYYEAGFDLDSQWWWQPIWGCYKCVSGWFGLVAYLYHYHAAYQWWAHAYFVVLAILFSLLINKVVAWTQ